MKILAGLLAVLAAGAAALPQPRYVHNLYTASLEAYHRGQYRQALEGFMEVLLEEPAYPEAQKYFRMTGQALLDIENKRTLDESRLLISQIEAMRGAEEMRLRRNREFAAWRSLARQALENAREAQNLRLAALTYERALDAFPVFSGHFEEFRSAQDDFSEVIQRMRWKAKGLVLMTREPQAQQDLERVRFKERRLENLLVMVDRAARRFRGQEYAESAELSERVLRELPGNFEARYYRERSLAFLAPAAPAAKSPPERPSAPPAPPTPPPMRAEPLAQPFRPAFEPAPKPVRPQARPAAAPAKPSTAAPAEAAKARTEDQERPPAVSAQEYYAKGLVAYSVGNLDEAIAHWRTCLKLDPDHPKARRALERVLREKK